MDYVDTYSFLHLGVRELTEQRAFQAQTTDHGTSMLTTSGAHAAYAAATHISRGLMLPNLPTQILAHVVPNNLHSGLQPATGQPGLQPGHLQPGSLPSQLNPSSITSAAIAAADALWPPSPPNRQIPLGHQTTTVGMHMPVGSAPMSGHMQSGMVQPSLSEALGASLPYNTQHLHATGIPGLDVPVEVVDDMAPHRANGANGDVLDASLHHAALHHGLTPPPAASNYGGSLAVRGGVEPPGMQMGLHAAPPHMFDQPDGLFPESDAGMLHQPVSHLHHHHHHYRHPAMSLPPKGPPLQHAEIEELARAAGELEEAVGELKQMLPQLLPPTEFPTMHGYAPPGL